GIWLIGTDGRGTPTGLPGARAPLFSPRGDALLFERAGGIGCHPLDAPAPDWCRETLLKLPGANTGVAFSPDGARLAFTSDRGDHAFVGVLELASGEVRWMAPDFNRDSHPAWSPEGRELAFLRLAGARNDEKFDLTAKRPFEVWVADAATGEGRRLSRSG